MVQTLIAFLLLAAQTTPPAEAEPVTDEAQIVRSEPTEEAQPEEPEEELICRTIRIPSERVGQRFRKREVCQTREEWDEERRARR